MALKVFKVFFLFVYMCVVKKDTANYLTKISVDALSFYSRKCKDKSIGSREKHAYSF